MCCGPIVSKRIRRSEVLNRSPNKMQLEVDGSEKKTKTLIKKVKSKKLKTAMKKMYGYVQAAQKSIEYKS